MLWHNNLTSSREIRTAGQPTTLVSRRGQTATTAATTVATERSKALGERRNAVLAGLFYIMDGASLQEFDVVTLKITPPEFLDVVADPLLHTKC